MPALSKSVLMQILLKMVLAIAMQTGLPTTSLILQFNTFIKSLLKYTCFSFLNWQMMSSAYSVYVGRRDQTHFKKLLFCLFSPVNYCYLTACLYGERSIKFYIGWPVFPCYITMKIPAISPSSWNSRNESTDNW